MPSPDRDRKPPSPRGSGRRSRRLVSGRIGRRRRSPPSGTLPTRWRAGPTRTGGSRRPRPTPRSGSPPPEAPARRCPPGRRGPATPAGAGRRHGRQPAAVDPRLSQGEATGDMAPSDAGTTVDPQDQAPGGHDRLPSVYGEQSSCGEQVPPDTGAGGPLAHLEGEQRAVGGDARIAPAPHGHRGADGAVGHRNGGPPPPGAQKRTEPDGHDEDGRQGGAVVEPAPAVRGPLDSGSEALASQLRRRTRHVGPAAGVGVVSGVGATLGPVRSVQASKRRVSDGEPSRHAGDGASEARGPDGNRAAGDSGAAPTGPVDALPYRVRREPSPGVGEADDVAAGQAQAHADRVMARGVVVLHDPGVDRRRPRPAPASRRWIPCRGR